jgi:hypothetical protein
VVHFRVKRESLQSDQTFRDAACTTGVTERMSPSNEHELAIALVVDRMDTEGRLKLISIQEVVNTVDFKLTAPESAFLMNYLQWRMANPIQK